MGAPANAPLGLRIHVPETVRQEAGLGPDWAFFWFSLPKPSHDGEVTASRLVEAFWVKATVADPPKVKLTCEGAALPMRCPLSVLQNGAIVRLHPLDEELHAFVPTRLDTAQEGPGAGDVRVSLNDLRELLAGAPPPASQPQHAAPQIAAPAPAGAAAKAPSRNARRKKLARQTRRAQRLAQPAVGSAPRQAANAAAAGPSSKAPAKNASTRAITGSQTIRARQAPLLADGTNAGGRSGSSGSSDSDSSSSSTSSSSEEAPKHDVALDVGPDAGLSPAPPAASPAAVDTDAPARNSPGNDTVPTEPSPVDALVEMLGADRNVPNAAAVEALPQATFAGVAIDLGLRSVPHSSRNPCFQ